MEEYPATSFVPLGEDCYKKQFFTTKLIVWYDTNKRILPWRETQDPYKIWLSEIILQQTRVVQGLPYYKKFIERYPTVQDLAQTAEGEVLRLWQGLGYYTRARNLHACAQVVANELDGKFPNNYRELLQLKGVGPYTAAAIAAIAFKEPVAVVDGNVYRVLARVFGIILDITSSQGGKKIHALATSLVPKNKPHIYSQAIMEFGALQCTPVNPACTICIFKVCCVAFHTKRQGTLPVKNKKIKIRNRFLHYFVLQKNDMIYMRYREKEDIWKGLYDFYVVETAKELNIKQLEDKLAVKILADNLSIKKAPYQYKHVLTHQRLWVDFYIVMVTKNFLDEAQTILKQSNVYPITIASSRRLPKSILIHNFLEKVFYKIY